MYILPHIKTAAPVGQPSNITQSGEPRETASAPDNRDAESTSDEPAKNRVIRGISRSPEQKPPKTTAVIMRDTCRTVATSAQMPRETARKTVRFSADITRTTFEVPHDTAMIRYVDKKITCSDSCSAPTEQAIQGSSKFARSKARQLSK